jgi:hypothetical protein
LRDATYVYCLVRSSRKPSAARVPEGLPGATAPAVAEIDRPLWLVASRVPLAQYGPEALEPALRDLDWVGRSAVAHEAVVEHFASAAAAAVIPMKLFTMFSTVERAVEAMRARRRALDRVFERIAGCEEWGVRVVRSKAAGAAKPAARPRSGTAFLTARKRARDASASAAAAATTAAEQAFSTLVELARDGRRRRDDAPAGAAPPLLDAAFLVPARGRARFHAAAERAARAVARSGATMTLTGPWPPYNFVGEEST